MHAFRTVLEQKIRERRLTFDEFAEYAETYAREHREQGTLSVRHLQRLAAGCRASGQPLGPLRPATIRLLEAIFELSIEELLAPPAPVSAARSPEPPGQAATVTVGPTLRLSSFDWLEGHRAEPRPVRTRESDGALPFDWLDDHAGWIPDTSRRKVAARLAKVNATELLDRHIRRSRASRSKITDALSSYYDDRVPGHGLYRVRFGQRVITTTVLTRRDWLDLTCPLAPGSDRLSLVDVARDTTSTSGDVVASRAVHRLAEAAALSVRVRDAPLYRLLDVHAGSSAIGGTVGLVPFVEYALTMDLLESELVDAIVAGSAARRGSLPLRDRYLPSLASVVDISHRLCVGGVLALCAIARPADPYRGGPDYALLVQERSGQVLNAARRLSVIPKAFHQPLTDIRADARIGATLRRGMEEELFGRREVDSTAGDRRVAAPMHPGRLSDPMRWLMTDSGRMRMECTGFGLNLMSGNYEFASLVVIEDEEFWSRFGGAIAANWEAAGLRVYSSLDCRLVDELASDESWSNEGLFAMLQGIRRLAEIGRNRVALPRTELGEWSR